MTDNLSSKPYDRLWFYVNWAAFCIGAFLPAIHRYLHPDLPTPHFAYAFFGLVLASISAHAVYAGYFAVRGAVYMRSERPWAYWSGIVSFGVMSLLAFRIALT
jgi:hypothetical protein